MNEPWQSLSPISAATTGKSWATGATFESKHDVALHGLSANACHAAATLFAGSCGLYTVHCDSALPPTTPPSKTRLAAPAERTAVSSDCIPLTAKPTAEQAPASPAWLPSRQHAHASAVSCPPAGSGASNRSKATPRL